MGPSPLLVPDGTTFLLKGSMLLDSQSSTTPYESSSFATPQAVAQCPLVFPAESVIIIENFESLQGGVQVPTGGTAHELLIER